MTVYFIGAGPGAADLITVRGARLLKTCEVCLYAGSLVAEELLELCPAEATLINTARMPLDEIITHIDNAHRAGSNVARLHSGDVSLYSAVAEQQRHLDALHIPSEFVPGVPAFSAAAAALHRELTVPGVGQSLLITRVSTLSTDMPPGEDLASLSASGVTLAIHLGAHRTSDIAATLLPIYGAHCPVAVVAYASQDREIIVSSTLARLDDDVRAHDIHRTAIIFVGKVLDAHNFPDSYLYSHDRMTHLAHDPTEHR